MANKNLSQKFSTLAGRKSILQQVMKPKDWLMLAVLLAVFLACWLWVWQAYSQPFGYETLIV